MARQKRIVVPGEVLHIVRRGADRQPIFFADRDYRVFVSALREAAVESGMRIHAYSLVRDHVQILATPDTAQAPARFMQMLGNRYVNHIKYEYRRHGPLWEDRYRSALVQAGLWVVDSMRYVEATATGGVAESFSNRWSSYHHTARGAFDPLISEHEAYRALGADARARRGHYQALSAEPLPDDTRERIRLSVQRGLVIGEMRFQHAIQERIGMRIFRYSHGGDRRSRTFRSGQGDVLNFG